MGREINISLPINRIVSLVPSQTELLFDLGLGQQVMGRTKFCIHPKGEIENVKIIGGTKTFHLEQIRELKPDIIIGNKEENQKELIHALENDFPIWLSDISSFDDALNMIKDLSILFNIEKVGDLMTKTITELFSNMPRFESHSVLYLIWSKPYIGVGNNTFINSMLDILGLNNVLSHTTRYPQLTEKQIFELNPDFIFLSSEPFPFNDEHVKKIHDFIANSRIEFVDGEKFSWYGSRLLQAPAYFTELHSRLLNI